MVEVKKGKRKRVSDCLENVGFDLDFRNQKLEEAQKDIDDWRHLREHTLEKKKEMREGFEARIQELTGFLKES